MSFMDYVFALTVIGFMLDKNNPYDTGIVTSNRFIYWTIVTAFVVTPMQQWGYIFIALVMRELIYFANETNQRAL